MVTALEISHCYPHLVDYEVRSGRMDRELFSVKQWCAKIRPGIPDSPL